MGGRDLDLDYIDDDNDIKEGDEFITSGLDRIYPKGLPVGMICHRSGRGAAFSRLVRVRPRRIWAASKKCFASSSVRRSSRQFADPA